MTESFNQAPELHFDASTEQNEQEHRYFYDAAIILGGGLSETSRGFTATDYRSEHSDQFGMLGAGMRIMAGTEMYLQGKANNFVFTTGVTSKNQEKFGHNVPTEARVYADKFTHILDGLRNISGYKERFEENKLKQPHILLEDRSNSTLTNIHEVLQMIKDHAWHKVALISSDYHIPRVQALYEQALAQVPELKCEIEFISAEQFAKEQLPGQYDQVIDKYYQSEHAQKRIENEQRGLEDIKAGRYSVTEFQRKDSFEEDLST